MLRLFFVTLLLWLGSLNPAMANWTGEYRDGVVTVQSSTDTTLTGNLVIKSYYGLRDDRVPMNVYNYTAGPAITFNNTAQLEVTSWAFEPLLPGGWLVKISAPGMREQNIIGRVPAPTAEASEPAAVRLVGSDVAIEVTETAPVLTPERLSELQSSVTLAGATGIAGAVAAFGVFGYLVSRGS